MLSDGYWQRRFARDPAVIGRTIRLSATPFTIVGVTPPEFFGVEVGTAPDLFLPIMMQPTVMPAFENLLDNPIVTGRGFRRSRAPSRASARIRRPRPWTPCFRARKSTPRGPVAKGPPPPPAGAHAGDGGVGAAPAVFAPVVRPAGHGRPRPADRLRQHRQSAAGAGRGAAAGVRDAARARRRPPPADAAVAGRKRDPGGVWAACAACCWRVGPRSFSSCSCRRDARRSRWISLPICGSWRSPRRCRSVTGLLFGLAPAWRATRIDLAPALKNVRGSVTRSLRPGRILSIAQLALSLVLLVGAGLFVRSLQKLNGEDTGGLRQSVVMLRVEPRGSDQRNIPGTSERLDRTYRELIRRAQEIPNVRLASMAQGTPTAPTSSAGLADPAAVRRAGARAVADGVPELLRHDRDPVGQRARLRLRRPRRKRAAGVHRQRVVCPAGLRRRESDRQAVPHRPAAKAVSPPDRPATAEPFHIVGVVKDSRYSNPRGETRPLIYMTFLQTDTGVGRWCCTYA